MILKGLRLENYRPFYGEQSLSFATQKSKNVTAIYGANGAGKTALLNAFTWGLYGETTKAFDRPKDLINHRAWMEAKVGDEVTCRVTITFEDGGREYTVERVTSATKEADGKPTPTRDAVMSLRFTDETGRDHVRENPGKAIGQLLPNRLHQFFFFDGERIEELVKPEAFEDIEMAIKTILGLEVIERATHHLEEARKELSREVSEHGSDEDRKLAERGEQLREQLVELEAGAKEIEDENRARHSEIERIDGELRENREARDLQERREGLEQSRRETNDQIKQSKDSIAKSIDDRGWLAWSDQLAETVGAAVDDHREKKQIPSIVQRKLIQDLLSDHSCICGRELPEGSPEYKEVESWEERAGDPEVSDAWSMLSANAQNVFSSRDQLYEYLHESSRELETHLQRRRRITEQLDEIGEALAKEESVEVRELELRRKELEKAVRDALMTLGSKRNDIERVGTELHEAERALEKAKSKNDEAAKAKRRVAVARQAGETLTKIYAVLTEEVRKHLDGRIRELFADISFKAYRASLTEDFRLKLTNTLEGLEQPVARSTGENQILSLAFVGAIAEYARERDRESGNDGGVEGLLTFSGGIYPLVMDSPFGSLDDSYQRQIAEALPRLAPQVIVLVSKSQGLNAVKDTLLPRVGKQAVIRFRTAKADADVESIDLVDGPHPFIEVSDDGYESALIEEV